VLELSPFALSLEVLAIQVEEDEIARGARKAAKSGGVQLTYQLN
jgi:hypothetical protein